MKYCLIAIIILSALKLSVSQQNILSFQNIKVNKSCSGEYVQKTLQPEYYLTYDGPYELTYLGSNIQELRLFYLGKKVDEGEIIKIEKEEDFKSLKIRFQIDQEIENPQISIGQVVVGKIIPNDLKIRLGCFYVKSDDNIINVSESCQDSVYLSFPFQGTQTNVNLYEEINNKYVLKDRITFYCCSFGNMYKIPRNIRKSKYKASIYGCHSNQTILFELR